MRAALARSLFRLMRSDWMEELHRLENAQWRPADELADGSHEKLAGMLRFACAHVPFYRDFSAQAGLDPDRVGPPDLGVFPLMTKKDLMDRQERFLAEGRNPEDRVTNATGGSSGVWFRFYVDRSALSLRVANAYRGAAWTGWRVGEKQAVLWGHPRDNQAIKGLRGRVMANLAHRSLNLNAYDMDEAKLAEFSRALRSWRPVMIRGYASALAFLADYMQEHGLPLDSPAGIISSAETLTDAYRSSIEGHFRCKLLNRYGSREFADIAQQCEQVDGFHVFNDRVHVEVLRPDGTPCDPGEQGEIVITDLENRVMPFIRYRTGDLARPRAGLCACGRGFPLLASVEGRTSELIVGKNGKYYSCQSPRLFGADIPGIGQMQLIQETIEAIEIRIVPDAAWTPESRTALEKRMLGLLGDIHLKVSLVEAIPPAPSGKYPFTISKVSPFHSREQP
ncbi:MAG: phenylacetate--CoA ligase family protein [Candidatus Krumholzibacteriia bacterium]